MRFSWLTVTQIQFPLWPEVAEAQGKNKSAHALLLSAGDCNGTSANGKDFTDARIYSC